VGDFTQGKGENVNRLSSRGPLKKGVFRDLIFALQTMLRAEEGRSDKKGGGGRIRTLKESKFHQESFKKRGSVTTPFLVSGKEKQKAKKPIESRHYGKKKKEEVGGGSTSSSTAPRGKRNAKKLQKGDQKMKQ